MQRPLPDTISGWTLAFDAAEAAYLDRLAAKPDGCGCDPDAAAEHFRDGLAMGWELAIGQVRDLLDRMALVAGHEQAIRPRQ
jgi:hypothetical protein